MENPKPNLGPFPLPALRQPPSRCSDGSVSNLLYKEGGNSNTLMVGDGSLYLKCRTRPYYFRRCKRVIPTNIDSLPDEMLSAILVRLPADYLHDRARLVCHRWYRIIHSDVFVNKQTQHSTNGLLLSCQSEWGGHHPILVTATQGRVETSEFTYKCRSTLFSSSNGLAMEIDHVEQYPGIFYIMNPATKQSRVLPLVPSKSPCGSVCGIAFTASSMKYKLVIPYWKSSEMFLSILTFGVDNYWRDVEVEHLPKHSRFAFRENPIITEGFMHWTSDIRGYILTMDAETEIVKYSKIPYPEGCIGAYHLPTEKFLSMLVAYNKFWFEVWGMNSETGEWRRVLPDIQFVAKRCRLRELGCGKDEVLEPLGWVKYSEVLAWRFDGDSRTCIFYNLDTHEFNTTELPYPCLCYRSFVHKNSLIGLG